MEVWLVVAWILVFGIATASVAAEKHRDPGVGFLIGATLGIIGLIWVGLLPAKDSGGRARRACPRCAEMVLAEARACRFCGTALTPEPTPSWPPQERPSRRSRPDPLLQLGCFLIVLGTAPLLFLVAAALQARH